MRFFDELPPLERAQLRLGQEVSLLRHLGFERLESFPHRLQVVPLPHHPDTGLRDDDPLLGELVGDAQLAPRGLGDRHPHDGVLNPRLDSVLVIGAAPADFLQRFLAAAFIELAEAIKAVAAVAHHPARVRDIAQLLRQF